MPYYLSKSDFKVARECITKLYYKKKGYSTITDSDPFMELLAEGGYMVGKLAQLLLPGELVAGVDNATDKTIELLKRQNVCIHEAAIESNGKLIRIDILNKKKETLELIEVKAKSWDSNSYSWDVNKTKRDFDEYLADVAFQYFVLHESFPQFEIKPFLFLPDKAKRTTIDGLNSLFTIRPMKKNFGGFISYEVDFTGDLDALRKDDIMTLVDVTQPVLEMQQEIVEKTTQFLSTLQPVLRKQQELISIHCCGCEYRVAEQEMPNGFAECWGDRAFTESHILELTQLGNINKVLKNGVNERIAAGLSSYRELNATDIINRYNNRPYYQITTTEELIERKLFEDLQFEFPICFIDFEVSKMALPYHRGMRPYENVTFQWSCHTMDRIGNIAHKDWINTTDSFPNFNFAETLMRHIRKAGTVLIWSPYENTILKDIYGQVETYGYNNPELKEWLEEFVRFNKDDNHGYIDQANLANLYYHHPITKGKYSIKYVLPAVLRENQNPKIEAWLLELNLLGRNPEGSVRNPYDMLPVIEVGESTMVRDGTGAIRAYQDMMYGLHKNDPAIKAKWEDALKQYCRLDTLAMVIIYQYWRDKAGLN